MVKRSQATLFAQLVALAFVLSGCLAPIGFEPVLIKYTHPPAILTPSIDGLIGSHLILGSSYDHSYTLGSDAPGLVLSDNLIVLTTDLPEKVYWIYVTRNGIDSTKVYFEVRRTAITSPSSPPLTDNQIAKMRRLWIGWQGDERLYNYYELYLRVVGTDLSYLTGPFYLTDGEFVYFERGSIQDFMTELGDRWEDLYLAQNTGDGLLYLIQRR